MGRKKDYIEVECCKCGKKEIRPRHRVRGKVYCNSCRGGSVELVCPICENKFKKFKSQMVKFPSGEPLKKICCSKKCRDIALRVDWNELTRGMLKQRWQKEFGKEDLYCRRCNYKNIYNIVIHHKQYVINGGDNNPNNLEPLCLNCHGEEHYNNPDND